jgi:hypothetical protein
MAKARSLVGLTCTPRRSSRVVLDAETGQVQHLRLGGDVPKTAAVCGGLCGRYTRSMTRVRRGMAWPITCIE